MLKAVRHDRSKSQQRTGGTTTTNRPKSKTLASQKVDADKKKKAAPAKGGWK